MSIAAWRHRKGRAGRGMARERAWLESSRAGDGEWRLTALGHWDLQAAGSLSATLDGFALDGGGAVSLDLSRLDAMDTVGAYLLSTLSDRLKAAGHGVDLSAIRPEHAALFEAVREVGPPPVERAQTHRPILDMLERTGRTAVDGLREGRDLLSFLGLIAITFGRLIVNPRRLRFRSVMFHIEQTGLNALPILGLLSFLIGVVLAFQGADQLRRFGAELFVVNLLGVSILREIGILMTAIIVAGRSGSAFTAQIGTMKVNQEVDAISTLGLDVVELLVVPRALALMITLPLLAFYADIMGLFGGAVMSYATLDITFGQFIRQLHGAVTLPHFLVGLVKAPVFALVIAMVGCYEGLKVSGSAESVGTLTTKSVVESIFLVIVLDAVFSVLFSFLRL
ncbi:MlaE family lipid ABC transporter permease subunit [Azospirillum brasilense]|uniref:MlaE family lipid ABC transporter permease subunit n=5 Tax=Azospirillum TaxID=191 RepID=A0A0P0FB93_AZOBR|nr:ABC transporter permease [Azospirillum brasilense]MBY3755677.1 MlaE family lipid ABC transporter permease subunit [Azospirillum formosense]NUB13660.1 MlaE family lipid ABC transporter permease subunit [Azospirillum brasilense]NUB18964.1 MlaE family lipid ABC transporter permease subunit [Azospirillum formosense]NUB23404.1 MlaE family lipid ABC transporter permease subunit [Azospirillum brasilense]